MPARSIHLIVNPVAGRGRAVRVLDEARTVFGRLGNISESLSTGIGEEELLAEAAARKGATAIVVIGGDGSFSHVARGIIRSRTCVPIAFIAAGTGNDFAKSMGAPAHDVAATARLVETNTTRLVDVGTVDEYTFINSAGFGFDAEVLGQTSRTGGGSSTRYAAAALRQLVGYRGFEAELCLSGGSMRAISASSAMGASRLHSDGAFEQWLTIVFANGRWFGGMFQIAPDARIDDGLIDCIGIRDASTLQRASLFVRAIRGAHVHSSAVRTARQAGYTLRFPVAPRFQLDGELMQASGSIVRIGVLPGALAVFAR